MATNDAGTNWTTVTDTNTQFTSMGTGAVSYDVTNSNVLVAGYGLHVSFGGVGGRRPG